MATSFPRSSAASFTSEQSGVKYCFCPSTLPSTAWIEFYFCLQLQISFFAVACPSPRPFFLSGYWSQSILLSLWTFCNQFDYKLSSCSVFFSSAEVSLPFMIIHGALVFIFIPVALLGIYLDFHWNTSTTNEKPYHCSVSLPNLHSSLSRQDLFPSHWTCTFSSWFVLLFAMGLQIKTWIQFKNKGK